ncbi:shikimate dehydrogenase [Lachnospiraceae bacterium ASD3451]|uniref:shikimate dehydrogenase n=1 Tax=Diplocloster agilis TaxID=2850323 RepID=UPI001DA414D1|nr:shikimate dehydrogenase [Diplocloster agilis]MBU9747232.1 shikimate dehydrogenase [Diplocloster agilis]
MPDTNEKCYRKEFITVFGSPVDENPTVVIMDAAFEALGLDWIYNAFEVYPQDLETAVHSIKALHMKGANCTIPHKVAVMKYLDHISDAASIIGAVNTIYLKDGETYGENSDGKGFTKALEEEQIPITDKNYVLLGAGGAAKAIAVELALAGAGKITVVNRSRERGEDLVELLRAKTPVKADFVLWDHSYELPADTDVLINCTSIGLYPDTSSPDLVYDSLRPNMVVCDVIPNPPQTPFLTKAQNRGCHTLNGCAMLVNQGAINIKLWTGLDAPRDIMKAALLKEFQ